ncbi:MAG: 30S ribosomal protein S12 methylthiotransferase RimO [Gemmatimonadota bacterium]|nr:30S ribosomal protein S12 methylthiotransferase RimO [Gemmatimonadota bacterium]
MKVGLVTLGCDKNTVDSERYLAQLAAYGGEITSDLDEAEVIIVNTCGFIDAAKKESLDALIEAGEYKTSGACTTVVAVGCMVERHKGELRDALPEVDLFLGASETDRLVEELAARGALSGERLLEHPGVRLYSGDLPHVRYLKVSEGCDHGCAFCAIPLMRGKHRSFAPDEVVAEAQLLEMQGAREVNLVAQDLAHYGRDIRDRDARLPDLLRMLVEQTSIPWIRMLYLYATGITPQLLEIVAREPRIMPYIDMPIQHASDTVLERMRRPERARTIRANVARFRDAVPHLAIRTTCIVGFPGETESDFEQLLGFLEDVQFERVGVFTYSPQEGTRAAQLEDDVPERVKRDRLERVVDLQRMITAERYEARLGIPVQALVDRIDDVSGLGVARLPWQADDVDGVTYLDDAHAPGTLLQVIPREVVDDYDFSAETVRVISAPAADIASRLRRQLPLVSTTIGSFGR